ncbi:hypothetical protein ABPG74_009377 [Tetrahymena malaccensis]
MIIQSKFNFNQFICFVKNNLYLIYKQINQHIKNKQFQKSISNIINSVRKNSNISYQELLKDFLTIVVIYLVDLNLGIVLIQKVNGKQKVQPFLEIFLISINQPTFLNCNFNQ